MTRTVVTWLALSFLTRQASELEREGERASERDGSI